MLRQVCTVSKSAESGLREKGRLIGRFLEKKEVPGRIYSAGDTSLRRGPS